MDIKKLEYLLHLGIWLMFLLGYVVIYNQYLPFIFSLKRGIWNVLPMASFFYASLYLVNQFLERKRYGQFTIWIILLFAIVTLLRAQINLHLPELETQNNITNQPSTWIFAAFLTNLVVLSLGILYQLLYNRYQKEKQNLAIINEQRAAEIQSLRAQINPHFLFNTLNNIYSLAIVKSDQTADMVLRLSNLLRYAVYESKEEKVSLKREVEQIDAFIELFQMKSEFPLNITFEKQGDFNSSSIEPMILIPIVENCFKHCDFDGNADAFVRIQLKLEKGQLCFQTINSKNDADKQKDQVGGVGLENIRKRLELKYRGFYQMEVRKEKETFELKLLLENIT